jgi:hypothetical protein
MGFKTIPEGKDAQGKDKIWERDQGITDNPCWPKRLVDDPGFALVFNGKMI